MDLKKLEMLGRVDLAIADVKKLGKTSVKIAFTYNPKFGALTQNQLKGIFALHLPELEPQMITALRTGSTVVVIATAKNITRPAKDQKKLKPVVAGLKYLDSDMGTVWNLVKEDGETVLQQVNRFDIKALVDERAKRMGRTSVKTNVRATVVNLMEGDTVRYWNNNQTAEAVVRKIDGDVVVVISNGHEEILPTDSIYKIVENNTAKVKLRTEAEKDYFAQVYGPDFAKDMVKK